MRCFAQVASEAVAIEADPAYCHKLQNISHELLERTGSYFAVRCARYQLGVPDADIYTWWQGQKYRRSGAAQRHISAWGEGKEREKLGSKRPFFLLNFRDFREEPAG